jgi:hypothetical protein
MPRTYTRLTEDAFWAKVEPEPNSGCWIWTGQRMKGARPYGRMRLVSVGERAVLAHRLAWIFTRGRVPDGLWVLHRCDRAWCVNPDHLFLGTPSDNTSDAIAKGRMRRCPQTVVNEADVRDIRAKASAGESRDVLASLYGITPHHVYQIVRRLRWAWLQ